MVAETVEPKANFSAVFKELDKLVKKWENIAKAQEKAATSVEKVLTKLGDTSKTVSDLAKSVNQAVKGFNDILRSQQALATQVNSTTSAIQKQKVALDSISKSNAKYAGDLVQRGMTQASMTGIGATFGEQANYKNTIGRLRELVASHGIAREQIQKMWEEIGRGETQAYTGALRKVRNALIETKVAREKLGEAERKSQAVLKASADAQEQVRLKTEAATKAIQRQAAIMQARNVASRKADSATSLLLQQGVTTADIKTKQSSPEEILNYKNAITRVRELRAQHNIAYKQIASMWADLGRGAIKSYVGGLSDVQTAMLKVKTAQNQLGASWTKAVDQQAAAFARTHLVSVNASKQTKQLKDHVEELTVSWKSFTRLVAVQVLHQAISALMRTIRDGIGTVIELGIRIGEIQTISQKLPLTVNQWVAGFRQLSDTWGGPLLDQVAAGYEAISDQIVEGSDTFKYLQEVNQFAVTAVSTTTEAVQLLDATINAFKLDTSRANEIAASFFATIDLGRVRASEMAQTFGQLAVPASQLGVSLNELQSMITVASRQGIKYNTTATYLRNVFLKLIKPTEEMQKYFREIGVETGQAAIETFGFMNLLTMLSEKFNDNTAEIGKLMGRLRAMQGTMSITGKNLQDVQKDYVEITKAIETYNEKMKFIMESTEKRLAIMMERIKNFFTVDIGKGLVDSIDQIGISLTAITAGVKAFSDTVMFGAVVAVLALLKSLLTLNPILAGITLGLSAFFVRRYQIRMDAERADEIDRLTTANQKKWLDQELAAINTAYDARKKKEDEIYQNHASKLALLKGLIASSIDSYEEPYKEFIESTGRLEEKVIDKIREQLNETKEELNRFSNIAAKKMKDFNKEAQHLDYIMERRLTGLDRTDRKEPDIEEKFKFVAGQITILEDELRQATININEDRFDTISAKLIETVKKAIDYSDQYTEEKGPGRQLIAHGESFYRYWVGEANRYKRILEGNAAVQAAVQAERHQALQDEASRVKDLANIITKTSWTDLQKIEDAEKFTKVFEEQKEALKALEQYGAKYGVDFYREAQLAVEKINTEHLIGLKQQEFAITAQQQIATEIKKRQDEELERNRQIWIDYVKFAQDASQSVRQAWLKMAIEDSTMGRNAAPRQASGRSAGIDTQAAWLSPQEMVMNPAASRKFYSTLVALNSSQRRFSSGSSGTTYNIGDVNLNGISQNVDQNIIRIGKGIRKQLRLGRLNLAT